MPESAREGTVARVRERWFAFVLGLAFATFVSLSHNPADLDVWARMAVGRIVLATGDVPRVDAFAFTETHGRWIDHEWLSGVVFDAVADGSGGQGLFALKLLLLAATLALLVTARAGRSAAGATRLAVLLPALAWSSVAWQNTVRSHVFTLLFVAWFAWSLGRFERGGRAWWLLPLVPISWIWAQLHGGVLVGLGVLVATTAWAMVRARDRVVPLAAVTGLSIGALFVGPYGPEYVRFLVGAVTMPRPGIREWEPLALLSGDALVPILFVVLLVVGACVDRGARRAAGPGLLLLALAAVFAFRHQRHVALFLLLAYVYGADLIAAPFERVASAFRFPRTVLARGAAHATEFASVFLLALVGVWWGRGAATPDVSWYPVDACRWLAESGPRGRLLVGFNEGSYALWRLSPRYQVSLDGRYEEVYPESTKRLVTEALDPESDGHAAALAAVAPDAILVRRAELEGASFGGAWIVAYRDERFDVWVRGSTQGETAGVGDVTASDDDVWRPPSFR